MMTDSSNAKATEKKKTSAGKRKSFLVKNKVAETGAPEVSAGASLAEEKGDAALEKGYVYILHCGDDTLYTGWTNDIAHRLAMHQSGKGAKYTRGRGPLTLVYCEELPSKSEALKREAAIKQLTREQKLALCKAWQEEQK